MKVAIDAPVGSPGVAEQETLGGIAVANGENGMSAENGFLEQAYLFNRDEISDFSFSPKFVLSKDVPMSSDSYGSPVGLST